MSRVFAILAVCALSLDAQQISGPLLNLATQPVSPGKASIQGKVVDSLTHEPIRKAIVTLNGAGFSLSAGTDAEGHFAFRQLPEGQYVIQAQSDKYPAGFGAINSNRPVWIRLKAEEEKDGVALALTPGGALLGRVVDEEGAPVRQCMVAAVQFVENGTRQDSISVGGILTDDKGQYRMENLPAGKYYVMAQCAEAIPLPHAFLRREDARKAPSLIYPAMFYPAAPQLSGASRVTVAPGASLAGIDFQMAPATGVTVRGHLRARQAGQMIIRLQPRDSKIARFQQQQAATEKGTGEFGIPNVPPGSYELTVTGLGEDCGCYADVPIEVGDTAPEPVDVPVLPTPRISGAVTMDHDDKAPAPILHVTLMPRAERFDGRVPQAQVAPDGTFTLTAPPGRWRLQVNGANAYIRSVTLGDQPVSSGNLETGADSAALKIVMSTKFSQIDAIVSGFSADVNMASGILWSAEEDGQVQQSFTARPQERVTFSVPPGRYHVCALGIEQPWLIQGHALLSALESRCTAVEVAEGDHPSVTLPLIPADDLKRLQDSLDIDAAAAPR